MARTPKPAPIPVPTRRGRKPKADATLPEPVMAGGTDAVGIEPAEAEAVTDVAVEQPVQGRRGRAPKHQAGTAISSVFQSDAGQHMVADVDPLEAAAGPTPAGDNPSIAEMADPVSASDDSDASSSAAGPDSDTAGPLGRSAAAPETPAAQWDRATDTVRFDWAEIERTASQDGPNQAMAKLLVAARAEGANSRWPL